MSLPEPPKLIDSLTHYKPLLSPTLNDTPDRRPAIVIDPGSSTFRAGWSFDSVPYLTFPSITAKPKSFTKEFPDSFTLIGHE
jgi:hypothetical protein